MRRLLALLATLTLAGALAAIPGPAQLDPAAVQWVQCPASG